MNTLKGKNIVQLITRNRSFDQTTENSQLKTLDKYLYISSQQNPYKCVLRSEDMLTLRSILGTHEILIRGANKQR